MELSKAYKALTDEDVRNNYIQYGHPDGKQSFSIGIALPKFIVTDGNGKYVLLVYGLLLGVLLPYIVGKWWYGTQRETKEKVLIASAGKLFMEWSDDINEGGITTALSVGEEYKEILKGDKAEYGLGKVENKVLAEGENGTTAAGLSLKDRQKLENMDGGLRRKVLALLWAYLGRIELDDTTLNDGLYFIPDVLWIYTDKPDREIRTCTNCADTERGFYRHLPCLWQRSTYPCFFPNFTEPYPSPLSRILSFTAATVHYLFDSPTYRRRQCKKPSNDPGLHAIIRGPTAKTSCRAWLVIRNPIQYCHFGGEANAGVQGGEGFLQGYW